MSSTILLVSALLAIVALLILVMRRVRAQSVGTENEIKICKTTGELCCGGGADCHKYADIHRPSRVQYFEDEELDRYRGRRASEYAPQEVAEWREIIETLDPAEVRSWVTSIHRRELHIPSEVVARVQELMSTVAQA